MELFTRETIGNYTSDHYAKNDHKYSKDLEKLIYLIKLFYIRKGPGVKCIQTPAEMIQYLEKNKSK